MVSTFSLWLISYSLSYIGGGWACCNLEGRSPPAENVTRFLELCPICYYKPVGRNGSGISILTGGVRPSNDLLPQWVHHMFAHGDCVCGLNMCQWSISHPAFMSFMIVLVKYVLLSVDARMAERTMDVLVEPKVMNWHSLPSFVGERPGWSSSLSN